MPRLSRGASAGSTRRGQNRSAAERLCKPGARLVRYGQPGSTLIRARSVFLDRPDRGLEPETGHDPRGARRPGVVAAQILLRAARDPDPERGVAEQALDR